MKKEFPKIVTCIGVAILFFSGNRVGFLIEYFKEQELEMIQIGIKVMTEFLPSFSRDFLGYKINFSLFSNLLGIICIGVGFYIKIYFDTKRKNFRDKEEHGSARYGDLEKEAIELKDSVDLEKNTIYSKNVRVTLDTRKTWLNNNALIIGGSGSGKTRFFVKPNALQLNCNYIITDPKDMLIREIGYVFYDNGYDMKYLNLIDMAKSMKYNPLKYIYKPSDVLKFVNNLIANTTKENKKNGGDDFFEKSEIALLTAIIFFILACGDESEKNLNTVMDLIDLAEASEEDEDAESILDIMFRQLKESNAILQSYGKQDKNSYAYLAERQYNLYKKAAGKTAKSILISVGVRMAVFNIPELRDLLSDDELDLETIGKPKIDENGNMIPTALFVAISDSDSTFNFMASIIHQQLYDLLYRIADATPKGRLPIHTRFIEDEFANTGKQQDFEIKIATMRSREISVVIILQNLAQLKNLYKDSWETIVGNCDVTLFLGGKEYSTLEQLSKWIGNTTIDYLNITENRGGQSSGSWSRSNQLIQRALLEPAEIGRLKKDECLVHIRGHHIYRDKKYDILSHPHICFTDDGGKDSFDSECIRNESVSKTNHEGSDVKKVQDMEGNIELLQETDRIHVDIMSVQELAEQISY